MPSLTIDDQEVAFSTGDTILEAAARAGIRIPTLCYLPGKPAQTSCFLCVVRVNGAQKLVPSCATRAVDGMRVANDSDDVRDSRRTAIELLLSDHLGDCIGPCQGVCPAHMDIPEMMRLTAAGRFRDALVNVKQAIALPAVLGRICPDLCEKGCRRSARDGALSVCLTKRFVADFDLASERPYLPDMASPSGKRVAIIGAGPAGLSAAYYLQPEGHACVLYDDHELPGGMLRYGVSPDDLPHSVLDAEIGLILSMGASFAGSMRVGKDVSIDELERDFDAVLITTGDIRQDSTLTVDRSGQGVRIDRSSMMTSRAGVFAAGSAVIASKHAVRAVGDGRSAAAAIDGYLSNAAAGWPARDWSVHVGRLEPNEIEPFIKFVNPRGRLEPKGGSAVGFTPEEVRREAQRCLRCACAKASGCKLRSYAADLGAQASRFDGDRREFEQDSSHPDIVFESGKCIACGICVSIASDAREQVGVGFVGRGFAVRTAVPFSLDMVNGLREVALACADACPTGALVRREASGVPLTQE